MYECVWGGGGDISIVKVLIFVGEDSKKMGGGGWRGYYYKLYIVLSFELVYLLY